MGSRDSYQAEVARVPPQQLHAAVQVTVHRLLKTAAVHCSGGPCRAGMKRWQCMSSTQHLPLTMLRSSQRGAALLAEAAMCLGGLCNKLDSAANLLDLALRSASLETNLALTSNVPGRLMQQAGQRRQPP